MHKKAITINGVITNWSIDELGNVYKLDGSIASPFPRTKGFPIYHIHGQNIQPFARLDRLMYENFLGGKYNDGIPIFHIDGNEWNCKVENLHIGFIEDPKYPNEIWAIYHIKNLPGAINNDVITEYWISTYGRCYGNMYEMFMKPHENMYPIRIGTDEIYWRRIVDMVADTFIPNPNNIPYAVQIVNNDDFSVSNISRSYDEYSYVPTKQTLPEDLKELYSKEFDISKSTLWKELLIDGYPSPYIISYFGNIYNTKTKHLMAFHIGSTGYYVVKVSCLGMPYDGKNIQLHRLIAQTFIPNPNNYPVVNHIDGNKLNCSIENLEWCTQQYNCIHAVKTGLNKPNYGDKHHGSKVKEAIAESIIVDYLNGLEPIDLERKYGVSKTHINYIVRGRRYKKLAEKYNLDSHYTRRMEFIEKYKPKINELLDQGMRSTKEIIAVLGIDYKTNRAFVSSFKRRYLNNKDKSSPE